MKTLSVPVQTFVEYQLTDADVHVLTHMLTSKYYSSISSFCLGNKVAAIKWFRLRFDTTLMAAKHAVEKFMNDLGDNAHV